MHLLQGLGVVRLALAERTCRANGVGALTDVGTDIVLTTEVFGVCALLVLRTALTLVVASLVWPARRVVSIYGWQRIND